MSSLFIAKQGHGLGKSDFIKSSKLPIVSHQAPIPLKVYSSMSPKISEHIMSQTGSLSNDLCQCYLIPMCICFYHQFATMDDPRLAHYPLALQAQSRSMTLKGFMWRAAVYKLRRFQVRWRHFTNTVISRVIEGRGNLSSHIELLRSCANP